jgi:sensor histidine kinase YesM
MGRHPLEIFPFFRRWRCGFWRDVLYTAIWSALVALVFSAFSLVFDTESPPLRVIGANLVVGQCIGYAIHALFLVMDWLIPAARPVGTIVRVLQFAIVPAAGVFLGYWIASWLLGWGSLQVMLTGRGIVSIAMVALLVTCALLAILIPRERAARAQARISREEARVAAAEKSATIARMQLLEAQVEPHFLYNTLAHVVSMIDAEPANARRMLDRLIELLRAAATSSSGGSSLDVQVAHLRAYLDILELRMGTRLSWTIDVPRELGALSVPPMLLQPLVENAIKHGLEPKVEGGKVAVAARRDGDRLSLCVTDTGLGFRGHQRGGSTGLGLANLRARLSTLFGARATLTIEDHAPSGTCVTIALPVTGATP